MIRSAHRPLFSFLSALAVALCLLHLDAEAQQRTKEFTIDDIFLGGKFASKSIRGFRWIQQGKAYSYLETDTSKKRTSLWKCDGASGRKTMVVDAAKLLVKGGEEPLTIQNYFWSPHETAILITGSLAARAMKTGGNM